MRLLKLRASKIFSLCDNISLNLDHQGLTLITGFSIDDNSANGSGKSTIANKAIIWTLFGQTAGGTKGDDVINRHLKGSNCWGEIIFDDKNSERYKIFRGRVPTTLKLEKFSMATLQWSNCTQRTQTDTQELINQILGRDVATFLQTDFFGQGRESSFLALTAAQQAEVLEQILPVENLSTWAIDSKNAKKQIRELVDKRMGWTDYYKGVLDENQQSQAGFRRGADKFEVDRTSQLTLLQFKLSAYETALAAQESRLTEIEEVLEKSQTYAHGELVNAKEAVMNWDQQVRVSKDNLEHLRIMQAKLEISIESKDSQLLNVEDNTCPTCGSLISDETCTGILVTQHELRGELDELTSQSNALRVNVDGKTFHHLQMEKTLADQRALVQQMETHNNSIMEAELELRKIYFEIDPKEKKRLEEEIEGVEAKMNPFIPELEKFKHSFERIKQAFSANRTSMAKAEKELDYLTFWQGAFSKDFKTYLFERACPYLQVRTEYHLDKLGNSQLKVKFSTEKELKSGEEKTEFNTFVYSDNGGVGFDSLSGGEQQMASFAVGLALADLAETQVQGTSHFLILDEPFMALDEKNCECLVNYLTNELSSKRETIFLISNEEHLKSLITRRIHVEKREGITYVRA